MSVFPVRGRNARGPRERRWFSSIAVAGALVVVWEGSKALFAIPRYMLPHVHEILGEFLREGADGTPWLLIMAQNAAYTGLESLAGFALGAITGLVLAVLFASSPSAAASGWAW